jgi:hypothetical protein
MFSHSFSEHLVVYKTFWKNIEQPDRTQLSIWRMRFACLITKVTDTLHIQYFMLFHGSEDYTNASHSCVPRTLPVLLNVSAYSWHHQGHFMTTINNTL